MVSSMVLGNTAISQMDMQIVILHVQEGVDTCGLLHVALHHDTKVLHGIYAIHNIYHTNIHGSVDVISNPI